MSLGQRSTFDIGSTQMQFVAAAVLLLVWDGRLPLADDGTEVLPLIVRQRGLDFAPGTERASSNGDFVVLDEIVARAG